MSPHILQHKLKTRIIAQCSQHHSYTQPDYATKQAIISPSSVNPYNLVLPKENSFNAPRQHNKHIRVHPFCILIAEKHDKTILLSMQPHPSFAFRPNSSRVHCTDCVKSYFVAMRRCKHQALHFAFSIRAAGILAGRLLILILLSTVDEVNEKCVSLHFFLYFVLCDKLLDARIAHRV